MTFGKTNSQKQIPHQSAIDLPIAKFFNSVSTALVLISEDGIILEKNIEFEHLFLDKLNEKSLINLVADNKQPAFKENLTNQKECFYIHIYQTKQSFVEIIFKRFYHNNQKLYIGTATKKVKTDPNSLLQQLIDTIPDNIFVKDVDSKFTLANRHATKILGVNTPKDLIGKTDFDFFSKDIAQKYYTDEQKIIHSSKPLLNELEKVPVNGRTRWYSTSKVPVFDQNGHISGIVGVGRDLTKQVKERKALEKAKKEAEIADKLKSTFLANLSHEIRTPLNGILGFSQFLKQKQHSEEKQKKYLDIILSNGKNLLILINDIIDISMIESNQLSIKLRDFNLNEVINQVQAHFEYQLSQKSSQIKLSAYKELPDGNDLIYSDDFRINQILTNLIFNAMKFTQEGEIKFGYKVDNGKIKFFVSDTGIGIRKDNLKDIFKRFRQADESMTRKYGGTGLGLSICQGLVSLLKGKIWVKSDVGKGSTFYFTIPLNRTNKK